ncbi:high frequency lysogenization protein HflD [Kitasatospora sp. NA04385]|uniref:high frequency lysogenization protein HflD n=1 Tax=Kitasatospora sp. NA04385 TaxID=2742135 RepID=UPI0015908017|nr:high frequency lysogenization protein HflD [Kitasatospora sp. NA04385]QKW23172.1 high frequency lysogenization protein HflD [Kitasatospora sp. NA04385]
MQTARPLARAGAVAAAALCLLALGAPAADAHPLGNFSLNHYLGLTVRPDAVEALAVTDAAEIPTLQEQPKVDRNGDGTADDAELAAWATEQCGLIAQHLQVTAGQDARPLAWRADSARFRYEDGSAGLRTSRLECVLHAGLHLPADGSAIRVDAGNDSGRVGWNEITARGDGVTLEGSDVPAESVSKELRDYPRDLLDSPSGVTRAQFRARPGGGAAPAGAAAVRADGSGPTAWLSGLDARLTGIGAAERLTVPLGLLAVLLSIVLGAGHALLPGHGKTVMAAYLAGRRGRTRDAVTVGATVTVTHTAGVIVIGLCLTTFSSLAGDVLLGWLGVLSGALVALVGAGLLRDAVRRSRRPRASAHLPQPQPGLDNAEARELAHAAAHAAGTPHDHDHDPHPEPDGHPHPHPHDHGHDHDHGHEHDHPHDHGHGHQHDHDHGHPHVHGQVGDLAHGHHGHRHGLFGGHHRHDPAPTSRRSLIGLGIAGGLVPSPSALVVLLGAVALGRTLFGAALVVAYGVGMAATLTAVGLLLVRVGDRLASAQRGPIAARVQRIAPYSALLTAALILTVGLGLVVRSLPSTL